MKEKEISRSEEVQEILGSIPSWILRWGIGLVFFIVCILLIGSYFVSYPDLIHTKIMIKSSKKEIKSQRVGKVKRIYIKENSKIRKGDKLLLFENSIGMDKISTLKEILSINKVDLELKALKKEKLSELGSLEFLYNNYSRCLHEYLNFIEDQFYSKKISIKKQQIQAYKRLHSETADYSVSLLEMKDKLLDLRHLNIKHKKVLFFKYTEAKNQMLRAIENWEKKCILFSNFNGTIHFSYPLHEGDYLNINQSLFYVCSKNKNQTIGKIQIPIDQIVKLRKNQKVIAFLPLPDSKTKRISGLISHIIQETSTKMCDVYVVFPYENDNMFDLEILANIIIGETRFFYKLFE